MKTKSSVHQESKIQNIINNDRLSFFKERLDCSYQFPAVQAFGQMHYQANKFGYHPTSINNQKNKVCPCCLLPIDVKDLSICTGTTPTIQEGVITQPFLLSSGISLFFTFIKFIVAYLLILSITVNFFSLAMSDLNKEYCSTSYNNKCSNSIYVNFSPVKNQIKQYSSYLILSEYLNFIMVCLSIIFFQFFRNYLFKIHNVLDYNQHTQDDFTLIVKYIPIMIQSQTQPYQYEKQLKNLFESKLEQFQRKVKERQRSSHIQQNFRSSMSQYSHIQNISCKVRSISLCFDLSDLQKIQQFRKLKMQQHIQNIQQNNQLMQDKQSIEIIKSINNQYIQYSKYFTQKRNFAFSITKFVGKAFVSFQYPQFKNYILQQYNKNPSQFKIRGKQIKIKPSTNPQDVLWQNLKVNKWSRIMNILTSYFILFFVLIITFLVLTSIQISSDYIGNKVNQNNKNNSMMSQGLSYGTIVLSVVITYLVNYLFTKIAKSLTNSEQHETKTKWMISFVIKLTISQFLNTSIMYLILSIYQSWNYLQNDGFVIKISNLVVLSSAISILSNILLVDRRFQSILKCLKYCRATPSKMFQINYNKSQQLPVFDFADRYSYYLVQLFVSLFYSYISPICAPITLLVVIIQYWIDKYVLFKCSSISFQMNFVVSRAVLKMFQMSILVFTCGNYYFSLRINPNPNRITLFGFIIALIYNILTIISPSSIQQMCCNNNQKEQNQSYTYCLQNNIFKHTYWSLNPVSRFTQQQDINDFRKILNKNSRMKLAKITDKKQNNDLQL